jgi:hypothetical protein
VFCVYLVVVDVDDDDDDDDEVHTATATTLDSSLYHTHCYWLPFCNAAFCSVS